MAEELEVLVALQPGDHCRDQIDAAVGWARIFGGRIDLFTVVEPVVPLDPTSAMGEALDDPEETALSWLEGLARRIPEDQRGRARVGAGRALEVLVEESARYGLLVVGTHHRTDLARLFLGSVAEGVVRRAKCPVLVLGPDAPSPIDPLKVRAPIDPSEPDLAAIRWVHARVPGAGVTAVYALPWLGLFGPIPGDGQQIYDQAKRELRSALEVAGHPDLDSLVIVREETHVGEAIAHEAADAGASLIALTTHGRTGIVRAFIGSVAERVVRAASTAVLVLR